MKAKISLVALAVALLVTARPAPDVTLAAPQLQTIIVNNTADSGPGTLREALERATAGTTITFDPAVFPPGDPATIFVLSSLPELAQGQLTIDASDAGVILDGRQSPRTQPVPGLMISSPGNTIRGLQILRFSGGGIILERAARDNIIGGDRTRGTGPSGQGNVISGNGQTGVTIKGPGATNNVVSGNYVGTDASGSVALRNQTGVGITDGAAENTVGGDQAGEANVISGNEMDGLIIAGAASADNNVIGNYIGVGASGTVAIGNGAAGVWLGMGAHHNVIGGSHPGERNIISGGRENGVVIDGSSYNTVSGNFIGMDVSGTLPIGNDNIGIVLAWGAQHNLVGGAIPGERNLISGNGNVGVSVADPNTNWNTVSGNYVGTDVTGTKAAGNAGTGIHINNGASYNVIGGTSPGESNLISGNGGNGLNIDGSETTGNSVTGNLIGTDFDGSEALGNAGQGVSVSSGAQLNVIGPANTIAYNGENGVAVRGAQTLGNTITANSIYRNEGPAILNSEGGNAELAAPRIVDISARTIRGQAPPGSRVEVFCDENDQGRVFQGSARADDEGRFIFTLPVGTFAGPNVSSTATDGDGNTSQFSPSRPSGAPALTRELPGIVAPAQVSIEPKVVGTNLSLALFCVVFFGLTSNLFNTILKDYRDELHRASGRLVPQRLRGYVSKIRLRLPSMGQHGRTRLLLMWLVVLLATSVIESFLDPKIGALETERLQLLTTLFISALIVSGLEVATDVYAHRRWAPGLTAQARVQWLGMVIALGCVLLSRTLEFTPGYLYGIVGAVYVLPRLPGASESGKRAAAVLATVWGGGLVLWLSTAFLPGPLTELEPLLLTAFLLGLEGVFFALIPLAFTDGGQLWNWRKGVWLAFFAVVLFSFYHLVLNPNASDVQALQQNGVQTLLALVIVLGIATLILWLLFPFRLRRRERAT